ncbi:chaperonin GroEL [Parvularcula bermudensis HTCC2503]|uniref:Chaperonin GroEL n=1 Tax=Parvularcula bermudensis (strain ATCC BAA-594 / HTCC2503 / KCTC 12087) TaxID=314260 RepID=E0TBK3_PARBH|nr:hypothetical protein [Parvularcula bermudensis]ADM08378.1 chaperonin GroEL [Parvularcula bermudensis HTCC2503]
MTPSPLRLCLLFVLAVGSAACAASPAGGTDAPLLTPALLIGDEDDARAVIRQTLAEALARPSLALGPTELHRSSLIPLLPPPSANAPGKSLARPQTVTLAHSEAQCWLTGGPLPRPLRLPPLLRCRAEG